MIQFLLQKRAILFLLILISTILVSCDPIPLEEQDTKIINGSSTHVISFNNSEIIVTPSKDERLELSESMPEKHMIQLLNLNESITMSKTIKRSDVIDFYLNDNIVSKIYVAQIPNYNEVWLSIDGKKAMRYKKGDKIKLKKPFIASVENIQFKEQNDLLESMVEFSFYIEEQEKYETYLIEQNIGLHEYLESIQTGANKYSAIYADVSVTVQPLKTSFPKEFPNKEFVYDFYNSYIYRLPSGEGVVWLSYLENKPYVITVNKNMEGIILTYLDKYPSFITSKTYCEKEVMLEEREATNVTFHNQNIRIEVSSILDTTVETKLKINDGLTIKRGIQEGYEINDNAYLIVDQIEINFEDKKDRVRLCLV